MRPGMSDGRAFTNYLSNCQMNSIIQEKTTFQMMQHIENFYKKMLKQL